jgi:hypothetical protein
MARTPLDPSLLDAHPERSGADAERLQALVRELSPAAHALAEAVFVREVADTIDGPARAALASIARDPRALDFSAIEAARAAALRAALSRDEREAIAAHAEEIASTLAGAWVDLWSRAVADSEDALRVQTVAPDAASLAAAWAQTAALLGLSVAEADALVRSLLERVRRDGIILELPLGLQLDGRATDLWMHHASRPSALAAEVVRSGEQLRGPAVSLEEERKKRGR